MNAKSLLTLIVVIAVVGLGILWWSPWQAWAPIDSGPDVDSGPDEASTNTQSPPDDPVAEVDDDVAGTDFPNDDPGEDLPPQELVTYNSSGFSPESITIEAGTAIIFRNDGSSAFWPAVDLHPTHAQYDGTTRSEHCPDPENAVFDACESIAPGPESTYEFTFDEVGEWSYHDHLNPSSGGTIIVE